MPNAKETLSPEQISQRPLIEMLVKHSSVIEKISEVLVILHSKRATLEEIMIRSYLVKLASAQGKIAEQILAELETPELRFSQEYVERFILLSDEIKISLESFLKAAKYDLNYLEQYFEHQFISGLQESNNLVDTLKLLDSLPPEKAEEDRSAVQPEAEIE